MKSIDKIKLFVLDMDGTIYLGSKLFPWTHGFLKRIVESGRKYIFFTNNSSKSPEAYIEKLAGMDIRIAGNEILTSGDVTVKYLNEYRKNKTVYLLGTPSLEFQFIQGEIKVVEENPDIVVVGYDTTLTYPRLEAACRYLSEGAEFIATHRDVNCPTEYGFAPDTGAMCAMITASTGKTPKYMGKPSAETVELVISHTGFDRDEICFVGDRLITDIATGFYNGMMSILVMSGETTPEMLAESEIKPDFVFQNIGDLIL